MHELKIGHVTLEELGTGVSVFLFPENTTGAYFICGSAPATHEINVLDSDSSVPYVNALVLSGGSAYGLFTALGVMNYLTEYGIGQPTPHGKVPIVPAAAIYDLDHLSYVPPTAFHAYEACQSAHFDNTAAGRIGAGTGATVGKLVHQARPMTGGLGRAELCLDNGVSVLCYAVVNSVGDIKNETGDFVAGARDSAGYFADCKKHLLTGGGGKNLFEHANTTLIAIFTDAYFSKDGLKRLAKMASAGIAQAICPVFTRFDGDIVFSFSLGNKVAPELAVGTLAVEAVRLAILDAVKASVMI